jgi:uncharacterized damage-inducible protein DinB
MWDTHSSASDISELIEESTQALSQLAQFVSGLSPDQYQRSFGLQGQHTTGRHVRHIIDHYDVFLHALDDESRCKVNYEHRRRERALERAPDIACRRLLTVCRVLPQLENDDHRRPILLDYPTGTRTIELDSSIGRELVFLSSHTIHHTTIIGLLAEQLDIRPPKDFGVHPSTLRHWQREASTLTGASDVCSERTA